MTNINVLKDRAVSHYRKYKQAVNEIYEIDELEGDKLNRYIDEQE